MNPAEVRITYIDTCTQCGSTTKRQLTQIHYDVDGLSIDVENVPASVCPNCGEKFIPGDVGRLISKQVSIFVKNARESSVTRGSVVIDSGHPETALNWSPA